MEFLLIKSVADESEQDKDVSAIKQRNKKSVLKSSFASAFTSIINKNVEDKEQGPILAKYKKPEKEIKAEQLKDKELRLKKAEKEK